MLVSQASAAFDAQRALEATSKYPKPANFHPAYGTAGFRCEASLLTSTVLRCGLLTAARSLVTGQACGLMITASHNPEHDNGVKIVEPDGGMLVAAWEALATELACATDGQQVVQVLQRLSSDHQAQLTERPAGQNAVVLLGCDTRPSAPTLVTAACDGIAAMGATVLNLGQVTTPQLHFQVVAYNATAAEKTSQAATAADKLSAPDMQTYFNTLLNGFEKLLGSCKEAPSQQAAATTTTTLYVDCANGVGASQMQVVAERLSTGSTELQLQLLNMGGEPGSLNHHCGADFVQKEVVAPTSFEGLPADSRCCSIDGDADRLVYFQLLGQPTTGGTTRRHITLLDGDKIAALAASLLRELVAGLPADLHGIQIGVVQTAYANGASTHYLEHTLGLQVVCTKTGVKHLHPMAHKFDIGIYFEANGHGTVLFAPKLLQQLKQVCDQNAAAKHLLCVSQCVNQTVGDALSGILLVEAALRFKSWGLSEWRDMYHDLPSKQRKLVVKDRSVLVSHDPAERRVSAPAGLQERIDALVQTAGTQARAFVRASGTEDAVRVYAEASTQQAADTLALQVAQAVHELAGGVGPRPEQ